MRGRASDAADALLAAHRTETPDAAWRHGVVVATLQALKRAGRYDEALAFADTEQQRHWQRSPDFYFAVADLYLDYASHRPDIAMAELLPVVEGAWKRCLEIGDAQRLRAHDATAAAGADVNWRSDQIDVLAGLSHVPTLVDRSIA